MKYFDNNESNIKIEDSIEIDTINYYLSNDEKARKIADRGFTKLLQHHTTQQRASQFLSLIEEYL